MRGIHGKANQRFIRLSITQAEPAIMASGFSAPSDYPLRVIAHMLGNLPGLSGQLTVLPGKRVGKERQQRFNVGLVSEFPMRCDPKSGLRAFW